MATIRSYRPTDHGEGRGLWAELVEQQRELYGDDTIGGPDPGAGFEEYLTRLDLSGVWVAEDEDEGVVGLVGLILRGRTGEVEPVVVTQRMRSRGIGRALLAHIADEARSRGLRALSIAPFTRDEVAIRRFHAAGYDVMSSVQLTLDLDQSDRRWQDGLELRDLTFRY